MTAYVKTTYLHTPRINRLGRLFRIWRSLRKQRTRLADLDDHILRDIGVTRDMALKESKRPFWDAPPHWRS